MACDLLHDRDGALADERDRHPMGSHAMARDAADGAGRKVLNNEDSGATFPLADHCIRVTRAGVVPPGGKPSVSLCIGDAPMAVQQTATCPECSRTISPEDTIVFGFGLLGHLDCHRPRVLSAEERILLVIYCRDHQVAECVGCTRKFHLREVASLDLGVAPTSARGVTRT
jgi:hypothetical protein